VLASVFILALLVLRFCTETHAADLYPPPPAPPATGFHRLNWFSAALAHGAHWVDACYFNNCAHTLQVGRRGWNDATPYADRMVPVVRADIQQLSGCEMRPDGAVLHCKEYMTNADSFWVLAWDGTHQQPNNDSRP
jgi:hypothetical protein